MMFAFGGMEGIHQHAYSLLLDTVGMPETEYRAFSEYEEMADKHSDCKGNGGDLPPRRECAPLWHDEVLAILPEDRLTLLVGSYAQSYYLPATRTLSMTERVRRFRDFLPEVLPLPHPAWRSTLWMRQNPWFETEVLPVLRTRIAAILA